MPNTAKKIGKRDTPSIPKKYHAIASRPTVSFTVPETEEEYDALDALVQHLLMASNYSEEHPLTPLVTALGELLATYDEAQAPTEKKSAREMLAYMMEEAGLTQKDLPEIGSQGVVSEVLNGKRPLNLRQIKALAARFKVSPLLLMD